MSHKRTAGFSLLEVLIAIVLLAIGVLAVVRSLAVMSHTLAVSAVLTRSGVIGSSQMEDLISRGCRDGGSWTASVSGVQVIKHVAAEPATRRLTVVLRYPVDFAERADTLASLLRCPDAS